MTNNKTICEGSDYSAPNIDTARRQFKNPNDGSALTFPWDKYTPDNGHRSDIGGTYNSYGQAGYHWKVGGQESVFDLRQLGTDVTAIHTYANQDGVQIHYLDEYTLAVNVRLGGYILDIDRFFLVS
jgi:hypothetical protein